MKLFEVTNGYTGFNYVRCYVIAKNKKKAIDIASKKYREDEPHKHESYWTNLEAECLAEDTTVECCTEIFD